VQRNGTVANGCRATTTARQHAVQNLSVVWAACCSTTWTPVSLPFVSSRRSPPLLCLRGASPPSCPVNWCCLLLLGLVLALVLLVVQFTFTFAIADAQCSTALALAFGLALLHPNWQLAGSACGNFACTTTATQLRARLQCCLLLLGLVLAPGTSLGDVGIEPCRRNRGIEAGNGNCQQPS
jgi:hypothetical protein